MELILLWIITGVMVALLVLAIGICTLLIRKYRGPKYPSTVKARRSRR